MEDIGEMLIVFDLKKPGRHLRVPMTPHHAGEHHHAHLMLTMPPPFGLSGIYSKRKILYLEAADLPMALQYLRSVYDFTMPALGLKYKPVARKIRPVATTLLEEA
jgi:hypothetical protein